MLDSELLQTVAKFCMNRRRLHASQNTKCKFLDVKASLIMRRHRGTWVIICFFYSRIFPVQENIIQFSVDTCHWYFREKASNLLLWSHEIETNLCQSFFALRFCSKNLCKLADFVTFATWSWLEVNTNTNPVNFQPHWTGFEVRNCISGSNWARPWARRLCWARTSLKNSK